MARITNFLKLWLPEADDVYNVEKDQNKNFEKIDAKLKEWDEGKENFIKDKKTAFNLDKTNLTENDSNKLFTAKGALDLFNRLTTAISTAVENMKNVLRTDIAKKIDKTSISDSLTSTSTTTVLNSAGAKSLEDKKLNISDAWKYFAKTIGNDETSTDLNGIFEPGWYVSNSSDKMFTNCPFGAKSAFVLHVTTPTPTVPDKYTIQTIYNFLDNRIYRRVKVDYKWKDFERIDAGAINWSNLPGKPSTFPPNSHKHDDRYILQSDAWKIHTKVIGNTTTATDLNNIKEAGDYISTSASNKWLSLPSGANPAFHLSVESIGSNYRVQILRHHTDNKMFRRVNASWDRWAWSAWERIDSLDKVNKAGDTMTGNLSINKVDGSYQLQRNGVSKMFLGFRNNTSTDIVLHSNEHGTEIFLNDKVRMNKDIYVNNSKVVTEAEAWRYIPKYIGNATTETDLNNIMEPGEYANIQNINRFRNTPADYVNLAFNLTVETINLESNYRTQTLKSYNDTRTYKRIYANENWSAWERIDSVKIKKIWSGWHSGVNTPVCTLPSDWQVVFIQYNWYSEYPNTMATEMLFKESKDFEMFGTGQEIVARVNAQNQVIMTRRGQSGDASIKAVFIIS